MSQINDYIPNISFRTFWGGPDRPPRFLRDVLEKRIHAVPEGGEILWVTYYFRDEKLAYALRQASQRGVNVSVVLEGNPRTGQINNQVIKILSDKNALGKRFRVLSHKIIDNRALKTCRLHEKLYYFSHPKPCALVGTFNPSGNYPEDPKIIDEIGDQDRGHNFLVEYYGCDLVQELRLHALRIIKTLHGPWERFLPSNNRVVSLGNTRLIFFPRLRSKQFDLLFSDLCRDCSLRIAVSHLNDKNVCNLLIGLRSNKGVHIEILAHDTQRRVPSWVDKQMLENGIIFNRYTHPEGLPMHNKFMLINTPDRNLVAFGSMNLSVRSLHANHELLVIDKSPELYNTFQLRWDEMISEMQRL